jgi:parvulin-like peptidyl-prolyl isomerase
MYADDTSNATQHPRAFHLTHSCKCLLSLGFLAAYVLGMPGCSKEKPVQNTADATVAKVGNASITKSEWQATLEAHGAQRAEVGRKKALLEELIQQKLLAEEGRSQGLDKSPEIARLVEQQVISRLVRQEVDEKAKAENVSTQAVDDYFKQHEAEFQQPESRRVSQLVLPTLKEAEQAAAKAKALKPGDEIGFGKLVEALSTDATSKRRAGDIGFITAGTPNANESIPIAAFALPSIGAISPPIADGSNFYVLRLSAIRPGTIRTKQELEPLIRSRLARELREQNMKHWIEKLRSNAKVEVFEAQL